jgi:hypothetical protein
MVNTVCRGIFYRRHLPGHDRSPFTVTVQFVFIVFENMFLGGYNPNLDKTRRETIFMNFKHLSLVLVPVSLVLCQSIIACTPSATPAPPAIPTTPTSPSTQPDTQPPSQPAQEESGIAALNLIDEPLPDKKLDVELVYSGGDQPGLCYLGSYAILAKYNDNAIDFTGVVANSGIGVSSRYIPQANLLIGGFSIGCIGTAAGNQGYEYYISALKGADITDTFLAADFPANAEEVMLVENGENALTLLKRLISKNHLSLILLTGRLFLTIWAQNISTII